jgi:ABC-type enterochelin transport system ATPase subunit
MTTVRSKQNIKMQLQALTEELLNSTASFYSDPVFNVYKKKIVQATVGRQVATNSVIAEAYDIDRKTLYQHEQQFDAFRRGVLIGREQK